MGVPAYLEKKSRLFWVTTGIALVAVLGIIDTLTGYEMSFSLFYLIPISMVSWFAGRRAGIMLTLYSSFVWFTADSLAGHAYSHPAIPYWNTCIRFGFFLVTSLLITALREALDHEKNLSRIDNLTGAVNRRYFDTLLQQEIDRTRRYGRPYTLAYVDLDNFKMVNDTAGHSEGDKVLQTVVNMARKQLRNVDVVARMGGDEFAFLFPETGQNQALDCIDKLQRVLQDGMLQHGWPVTFSIGVLTCDAAPQSHDELIRQADQLMYQVKNDGKNSIRYARFESPATLPGQAV